MKVFLRVISVLIGVYCFSGVFAVFGHIAAGRFADAATAALIVVLFACLAAFLWKKANAVRSNDVKKTKTIKTSIAPAKISPPPATQIDPLLAAVISDLENGVSMVEIARKVSEQTGMDTAECEEKIHTFVSCYHNGANISEYRAAGVKEYEFMATYDEEVCPICYALDGQHFKIEDAKIGVNYPPMHLGCRCCTIEYDPESKADLIASGLETPQEKKLPYTAFKKQLSDGREREIYNDSVQIAKTTADLSTFFSRYEFIWKYNKSDEDTEIYKSRLMMCIKRAESKAHQLKTSRGKINRLNKIISEIEACAPTNEKIKAIHQNAILYLQNAIKELEK